MKKVLQITLIALMGMLTIVSCDKTDPDPATFAGASISADNTVINVDFSKGVYKNDDATGNLDNANFVLSITGGTATIASYTVAHTAGETVAMITIELEGIANGEEVITVTGDMIYDDAGDVMADGQQVTVSLANLGIVGEWYSSGDNVAALLSLYFNVDSLYALFRADQTYLVESYDPDGVKTEYLGTYTQAQSDVDGIWTIVLNQSAPSSVTSEGIFGFYFDETAYDMMYEVVQTEPDLGNSPPTPDGGFGSSNGGALGDINIQKYLIIN